MTRDELERDGFVEDATDWLFYATDAVGAIVRFGKINRSGDGDEKGVEVTIDHAAQSAVVRDWTTRIHPHPDGDPEFTLAQFLQGERAAMLESSFKPACAFCGKGQSEVARLIAGPQSMICNECVELCSEILAS